MNSFTSSFKTEAKVIAVVLLALLACELAVRRFETSLSLDLQHIRAIPRLAKELSESKKMRILFLGNSFTRVSVAPDIFIAEMKSRGFDNLEVERVFPDGTKLNEWYYTFKNHFVEPNLSPNVLVILTGRAHLQDQPINPSVFGAYFSNKGDVPDFLGNPARSIADKMEFLLARYLAICANRHRIEPRVFNQIIPNYESCIQRINQERVRSSARPRYRRGPEYKRLEQLLELGQRNSVPIIFATVPMSHPYSIDPKIPQLIAEHKMTFVEADKIEGSHFPDGYHIDEAGAEKYTRKLAAKLAEIFGTNPAFQKARSSD